MGAAFARAALELAPGLRLLLVEEGGLPNEEGATILAPGVWHAGVPDGQRERVEATRARLGGRLNPCGLLELRPHLAEGFSRAADLWTPELRRLADPQHLPFTRLDPGAGTFSPASLTLENAQAAVRAGADLMLNARGLPRPDGAELQRLSVTNTHRVVVDHSLDVMAERVVVAAGAAGPGLVEVGLGALTPHRRAYRQSPRLNGPSSNRSPVLRAGGFTLRPQGGGYTVIPPIPHPDPWDYRPGGGRLLGVPVGLRREVLEAMLEMLEALPALASEALEVGRSLADVPGAWLALPEGGWPLWELLDASHWLLLGGPNADLTGLAVAEELARELTR